MVRCSCSSTLEQRLSSVCCQGVYLGTGPGGGGGGAGRGDYSPNNLALYNQCTTSLDPPQTTNYPHILYLYPNPGLHQAYRANSQETPLSS